MEDKNLKELLMKWGVEHPAANFTSQVMHQITSAYSYSTGATPLFKQKLPRILLGVFILLCFAILALAFISPVKALWPQFEISLPVNYLSQGFSFLIAFWVVMLFSLILKRYFLIAEDHWRSS